jgi:hypothetical protein
MKKIFLTFALALISAIAFSQDCQPYTLVKPNCTTISVTSGYMINTHIGDADFNNDYFSLGVKVGKFFNETFGVSGVFTYSSDCKDDYYYEVGTRLYTIGGEFNFRLTDYFKPSPMDITLNAGLAYGRFDFSSWFDSEGVNYVVPNVSIDLLYNVTPDKLFQLGIEPAYHQYIPTSDKWYFDNGDKVNSKIGGFSINMILKFNF